MQICCSGVHKTGLSLEEMNYFGKMVNSRYLTEMTVLFI